MKYLLTTGLLSAAFVVAGCGKSNDTAKPSTKEGAGNHANHGSHEEGPHGGAIAEIGKYHAEFCMDHAKKQATVYILEEDVKTAAPIANDKLLLSIKSPQFQVDLKADPQAGDPKGKSSRFVATHDNFAKEQEFAGTISGEIDGKPYFGEFKEEDHKDHKKAGGEKDAHGRTIVQSDPKEAEIYLKPGGIYTAADIKANGNTTVSEKYKALKVSHDIKPKVGDKLCPITLTKANSELTWIINGKKYEFCCPPCVDEFVELAKTKPGEIKEPDAYIKK